MLHFVKRRSGSQTLTKVARQASTEPVWNVLMPAGEWHRSDFPGGSINCDRAFFAAMISNWKKVGSPGLPIDRFHWGSSGDTSVRAEDKAAVGFIEDLRINSKGDLEGLTAWNADGKADIDADRFRYFSPEWHENWTDSTSGQPQGPTLFGGGLLNDPYFKSLPRLAANEAPAQENLMTREQLIALYSLAATATDADITAAAKKGADALKASDELVKRTAADQKRTGDLEAELKKANDAREADGKRIAALEEQAKKATEEKLETAGKALIEKLMSEGRITAAEQPFVIEDVKAFGLEKATTRWAARPVVVAGLDGIKPGTSKAGDVSPEEAHKQLELKAAEIRTKGGPDAAEAYLVAAKQNPELARQASRLTVTRKASA
jgi:phage I-like protein